MSTYVGVAEAAATRAVEIARPRAARPDIAPLIGRMGNRLTVARDTVRAMIDAADDLHFDNTLDHATLSLTRKTNATEAVVDTVRLAMEACGGQGFSRTAGLERLYRDVHGSWHHPLPAAQQELFSGRVALGLDPAG
jgi:alkylation response protein AidB-like acyl-CoA dehydrogenase